MKKPPLHQSFKYTFQGFFWLLRNERNFQIHIAGLLINLALVTILPLQPLEIIVVIGVSFLVLITEALNTCIEKICDYIQPNFDSRIGIIKDIAGAAVLLSAIFAVVVGLLVYWKYIFN
ncbi:diacylglycerol kinase [Soonwooa purpurea]